MILTLFHCSFIPGRSSLWSSKSRDCAERLTASGAQELCLPLVVRCADRAASHQVNLNLTSGLSLSKNRSLLLPPCRSFWRHQQVTSQLIFSSRKPRNAARSKYHLHSRQRVSTRSNLQKMYAGCLVSKYADRQQQKTVDEQNRARHCYMNFDKLT